MHPSPETLAVAIVQTWKSDAQVRHEFRNDVSTFEAYVKNKGDEGLSLVGLAPDSSGHEVSKKVFDEQATLDTWNNDPDTRREFSDDKTAFIAFERANAEGRARIHGNPGK